MVVAAIQGADQHFESQYLAQGHFVMQTRGIEPATPEPWLLVEIWMTVMVQPTELPSPEPPC